MSAQPTDPGEMARRGGVSRPRGRFALVFSLASLLLTALIARNIWLGIRGPDLAAARLAERKAYYEQVIGKAGLSLREAQFYVVEP